MYRAAHCFSWLHIFLIALKLIVPSIFYFRKVNVASCPLASYFSWAETSKCQAFSAAIFVLARLHFVHFATPRLFSSSRFFLGLFLYLQRDRVPGNNSSLASWQPFLLTDRMLLFKTELVADRILQWRECSGQSCAICCWLLSLRHSSTFRKPCPWAPGVQ